MDTLHYCRLSAYTSTSLKRHLQGYKILISSISPLLYLPFTQHFQKNFITKFVLPLFRLSHFSFQSIYNAFFCYQRYFTLWPFSKWMVSSMRTFVAIQTYLYFINIAETYSAHCYPFHLSLLLNVHSHLFLLAIMHRSSNHVHRSMKYYHTLCSSFLYSNPAYF